ncbi:SCO6880 family protein [Actinoplanes missouriensis]|uniref:SCO6880 family protein n=1 Tax=Actinoplanes missouriensis TaxID=1866 RepID=UPI00340193AE
MPRTALLGGELRGRGLLGGKRSRGENIGLLAGLILGALTLLGGSVTAIVSGFLIFGSSVVLFWRFGRRSVVALLIRELRWLNRRRRLLSWFAPAGAETTVRGRRGRGTRQRPVPSRAVPDGVGQVRVLSFEAGAGPLAIMHHTNADTAHYLSAVMEVDGLSGGLREDWEYDQAAARFGKLGAALAKESSLVRGLQLVNRVVPLDSAEHERWIARRVPAGVPEVLKGSYAQLIRMTASVSEQHRNFIVVRIPLTSRFFAVAGTYGKGEEAWCQVVYNEMARVAGLARNAGLRNPRGLGERRLAALMRALQDPDHLIDDHGDVDLASCWQASEAVRDAVVYNDKWHTRIAHVPADAVTPEPVHMRWLAPLLTDVTPAVIRTVTVLMDFVPVRKARPQAVSDVAQDRSSARTAADEGLVSDGSRELQMTASQQRLHDLRPGSGHHGVNYALFVSVTAPGREQLREACERVEEKASECGIAYLDWYDTEHDTAAVTTWPLWRGMEVA